MVIKHNNVLVLDDIELQLIDEALHQLVRNNHKFWMEYIDMDTNMGIYRYQKALKMARQVRECYKK